MIFETVVVMGLLILAIVTFANFYECTYLREHVNEHCSWLRSIQGRLDSDPDYDSDLESWS